MKNSQDIIDMVASGMAEEEIMEQLGIKSKSKLKSTYYDALVSAGIIEDISGARERRDPYVKKIGKHGTLVLGRNLMIDKYRFKLGDKFRVISLIEGCIFLIKIKTL
jgi:hypothetical protein